ncbi:hypothetical protein D3C87_1399130 [compost metagenome]
MISLKAARSSPNTRLAEIISVTVPISPEIDIKSIRCSALDKIIETAVAPVEPTSLCNSSIKMFLSEPSIMGDRARKIISTGASDRAV